MLEKFHRLYNLEEATDEAQKIKEKVDAGKAENCSESEKFYEREELESAFDAQSDLDAAHGVTTRELFVADANGKKHIEEKIAMILEKTIQCAAYFNLSKLYYEKDGNLDKALEIAEKISDNEERNRCFVHLAIAVLSEEFNISKAEEIIKRVSQDTKNYLEYYKKEKERIETLLRQGRI